MTVKNAAHRLGNLVIGPVNQCDLAVAWASAIRQARKVHATAVETDRDLLGRHREDVAGLAKRLPYRALTPLGLRYPLGAYVLRRAGLVLHELRPFMYDSSPSGLSREIGKLRASGRKVAFVAHGSEVRDPDRHMAAFVHSLYNEGPQAWVERLRQLSSANRELIKNTGGPTFVTTPDLVDDLPGAIWLPLVLNAADWQSAVPPLQRKKPMVMHFPSMSNPPIKGTRFITPVLKELEAQGRIELLSGARLSRVQLMQSLKQSDILIDQLLTYSYGLAAVEGMAAGRLVIGNVGTSVRGRIVRDVPMVDATPDSFRSTMESVLDEPGRYAHIASMGPSFVSEVHGSETVCRAVEEAFGAEVWRDLTAT